MTNNTAIFPGSFDPITIGHVDIIRRALKVFDKLTIAVGINPAKDYMFSVENRVTMIKKLFEKNTKVDIIKYTKLTIDVCQEHNIYNIVRGVRSSKDFEYEQQLSFANQKLNPNIETFFLSSSNENNCISSSIVKEIILNKGNIENFIPTEIISFINDLSITK